MRFTPKSEEELDTRTLLSAGECDFTITQATDEVSQNTNEMIHLVLRVENDKGQRNTLHDYLLEATGGKLRHFCEAVGLMDEYESGELTADHCANQTGRVRVAIEKGKGDYQDKNIVKDYLSRNGHAQKTATTRPASPPPSQGASIEGLAKKSWLAVWNRFVGEFPAEAPRRGEYWEKCFKGFFPGKLASALTAVEWAKFNKEVSKWDPMKGWPAKETPFGDEKQFSEDDIPF